MTCVFMINILGMGQQIATGNAIQDNSLTITESKVKIYGYWDRVNALTRIRQQTRRGLQPHEHSVSNNVQRLYTFLISMHSIRYPQGH